MKILVFTDNKTVKKCFSSLERSRSVEMIFSASSGFKKKIKEQQNIDLFYFDISGYEGKQLKSLLSGFKKLADIPYGIIDPKGRTEDIALLFFENCSDYIGNQLLKKKISFSRLKKAVLLRKKERIENEDKVQANKKYILTNNWGEIKSGEEYTFAFLFVSLSNVDELKLRYSMETLNRLDNKFHRFISDFAASHNGEVWIWSNFNGLILFPFNGKNCEAFLAGCRLFLNQTIINIEILNMRNISSFKIATHIGNTIYKKRGKTGKIVSEAVNFIFHLGLKYTQPESFYISDSVYQYIDKNIKENFNLVGQFEGQKVYKMVIAGSGRT